MSNFNNFSGNFWKNAKVVVLGGGSWGTVLAQLLSQNCSEVRLWVREESSARKINATRINADYHPQLQLNPNIQALSSEDRIFETKINALVWALPSTVCRTVSRHFAKFLYGDEIIFHATKGIEPGSLKRISEILREEWPCPRIGVISGPNLAAEIARGELAATVVASSFDEVIGAGQTLLSSPRFRVYGARDIIGVEWAGVLKNILAIAAGVLDGLQLGWNARAMLISRGLAEMVRFGLAMGAQESTFLGLAGMGDLLATSMSPLSRNFRVGAELAKHISLDEILSHLVGTAEGISTVRSVWEFAKANGILMPITEAVYHILYEKIPIQDAIASLMERPQMMDHPTATGLT